MKRIALLLITSLIYAASFAQTDTAAGYYPNGQLGKKLALKSISYAHPLYAVNATTAGVDTADFYVSSFAKIGDSIIITMLSGRRFAVKDSSGGSVGSGSSALSSITSATANNTFDNANYLQTWSWNSLVGTNGTSPAFTLSSNSTAGATGALSSILHIVRSGANANASHSAYGQTISVTNTGTTSSNYGLGITATGATTNVGLNVQAAGGTNNYAALLGGRVGINQNVPLYDLDVGGTINGATIRGGTFSPINNIDFGNGGGAHSIYLYNGGTAGTRTTFSYLTGTYNAGLLFSTYGGLNTAHILFSSGVDASTATVANSYMAIFNNTGNVSIGGAADVTNKRFNVTSTTKTSHPFPNMTEAQRLAITMTSANDGDGVWQTDAGTNGKGLYLYNDGVGWEKH